jgi:hypothetical protein
VAKLVRVTLFELAVLSFFIALTCIGALQLAVSWVVNVIEIGMQPLMRRIANI